MERPAISPIVKPGHYTHVSASEMLDQLLTENLGLAVAVATFKPDPFNPLFNEYGLGHLTHPFLVNDATNRAYSRFLSEHAVGASAIIIPGTAPSAQDLVVPTAQWLKRLGLNAEPFPQASYSDRDVNRSVMLFRDGRMEIKTQYARKDPRLAPILFDFRERRFA